MIAAGCCYIGRPEPGTIEIPYWSWDGKLTQFCRYRLPEPRHNGQKYHQEPGSGLHLYYPARFLHRSGTCSFGLAEDYAVVSEGEFKDLCLLELGVYAIGLPGIAVYTRDKEAGIRQLLPELQAALSRERIKNLYFLGDADTSTNYAFSRNASFLADAVRPIKVHLPRLPLNAPGKGVDDCREALGDKFHTFFTNVIKEATTL